MFRHLRYGVGAYLARIMVQGWGPFQQTGMGVSHSKRCGRTGCDHWSCDFLFWDLFRTFLTHDLPYYFFSLPLWAITGFYLDNSLELHEMQGRSVTRKIRIGFFDL